jgi:alpha-tubulin suppressor-like RCC1 family protein
VWGRNNHGQLGLGDLDDRSSPQMVQRIRKHRVMQVAGGWRHTIVLTDESKMFAWGMFSAVKHIYPRAMHDPDSDNTQFETHIPLEIPFNPSNVTSVHESKSPIRNGRRKKKNGGSEVNRASMPALRSIQGIACTSSRTLSLTTIQWQQKPGPEAMLRQPLLQHSMSVQKNQADNLLLDHKEHEPG